MTVATSRKSVSKVDRPGKAALDDVYMVAFEVVFLIKELGCFPPIGNVAGV